MNNEDLHLNDMTIDELSDYIVNNLNITLQFEIVGDEYYNIFINSNETKRKEMVLSELKQMQEDIIQSIIKNGKTR